MNVNLGNEGITCPRCGNTNKPGYRFCVKCGFNLASIPSPGPQVRAAEPPQTPKPMTFGSFEPEAPAAEPAKPSGFGTFEPATPAAEPSKPSAFETFEPEAPAAEPSKPSGFGTFEPAAPAAEPSKPSAFETFEPARPAAEQTFNSSGNAESGSESLKSASFSAFGSEPSGFERTAKEQPKGGETNTGLLSEGFAKSGFNRTPVTASVGAFATAVNAVKEDKKIDISDAQTVMSLLDSKEHSALAEGLPEWDIVPPQVVVRRKHRL